MEVVRKLLSIALVGAVTWLLRRAVLLGEASILSRKDLNNTGNFSGRALVTKVSVLRKIAMVLITVFAFAAVLMMFDEVRDIGRSILASAGVAGIILGLAAQRSLGNLFAGLQIALTQPMSNQAAAAVIVPIAIQTAAHLHLNPRPFVIATAVAASCSYLTPLEPACLMVYAPGHYKFSDFIRVGAPLTVILFVIAMLLIPHYWPLTVAK